MQQKRSYSSNVRGSQGHFQQAVSPPSAILAMRLSHPLHGSLLPPGICYTCDVCGKTLSTKLTLKRHKEQQHFQPLNSAVCALCHKVFRTLNSLNNHKSIYHRRQK
ncbi:BRC4 protein, partial [Pseudoatta argentina]